jgi:uncharacterized protein YndB with AHSA1/START domain
VAKGSFVQETKVPMASIRQKFPTTGNQLSITKIFNACPARVFEAWTNPLELVKWLGPEGFTSPVCKVDLTVGGEYHYCVRSPEGADFWSKGTFVEIDPGRKIVVADSFSDANGNIRLPASVGLPAGWPSTLLITVSFHEKDGITSLTLSHDNLPAEMLESCRAGWIESFNKLAKIL